MFLRMLWKPFISHTSFITFGALRFSEDKFVARSNPGIDIVVGGHSHAFLHNGKAPSVAGHYDEIWGSYPEQISSLVKEGKSTPVVQAGWGSRYVGELILSFDSNGNLLSSEGNTLLLGDSANSNFVQVDPHMQGLINFWENRL